MEWSLRKRRPGETPERNKPSESFACLHYKQPLIYLHYAVTSWYSVLSSAHRLKIRTLEASRWREAVQLLMSGIGCLLAAVRNIWEHWALGSWQGLAGNILCHVQTCLIGLGRESCLSILSCSQPLNIIWNSDFKTTLGLGPPLTCKRH